MTTRVIVCKTCGGTYSYSQGWANQEGTGYDTPRTTVLFLADDHARKYDTGQPCRSAYLLEACKP